MVSGGKRCPQGKKRSCFPLCPPPPDGVNIVTPSDEVLKKGNDKLRITIVGTFTKGSVSCTNVCDFARAHWGKQGLVHVGQKDEHTFFFKFDNELSMHNANLSISQIATGQKMG
ncbi:hypothetical protein POM88_010739 [Heracleum sosnowskyi]|uniref:DUF4283 domain-containing protein n=1 Tax=Heracleum sosnowskyi TaxID=360622 RepID=A0AAD8N1T6_9APIA|nr:hypothetical protein POM88_010739 [Heracleum sosnowskyi]